jgi:hypothetical protein
MEEGRVLKRVLEQVLKQVLEQVLELVQGTATRATCYYVSLS